MEEVFKLCLAHHLLWALESRARGWGPGRLHSPDDLLQTGGHGQEGSSCPGLQRLCFLVRWRQSQGVSSAHDFTPPLNTVIKTEEATGAKRKHHCGP